MANRMVNLRLDSRLLNAIDVEVRHGFWSNRTEFVKDALKAFLEERKKQALIASMRKRLGEGKRLGIKVPSPDKIEEAKEEAFKESLKRHGLEHLL